jgi:hypothetical protein
MSRDPIHIEDHAKRDDPASCGACNWTGTTGQVRRAIDAILTPGDSVPLGRCPRCHSMAYLARPHDLALDAAYDVLAALQRVRPLLARLAVSTAAEAQGASGTLGIVDAALALATDPAARRPWPARTTEEAA